MSALVKVDFYGDSIWAVAGDDPMVAVKPIVEGLGLDWRAQQQRIQRDDLLAEGACVIHVPSPGGPQATTALPLSLMPGFLFGIAAGRVPDPAVRAKVVTYKRECHRVLFEHFFGRRDVVSDVAGAELADKLRLVREMRLTHGRAAAQGLWRELGLPAPIAEPPWTIGEPNAGGTGVDFVRAFLVARTEPAAGRIRAGELFAAYQQWARESDSPAMTPNGFGMALRRLGVPGGSTGQHRFYAGLGLTSGRTSTEALAKTSVED